MSNGKGDRQRPSQISRDEWDENWDRIFGKYNKKKKEQELARKRKEKEQRMAQ